MSKTVAQVMTHNPIMVNPQTPLKQAIQILAEKQISGLPVVDDMGKLVGIISETDLMWQETGITPPAYIMFLDSVIYLQNPATYERDLHKALGQTVGEVMSNNPITISPDQSLNAAAKIIQDHKVRRLPVVDDSGTVIGILTRGDIIRTMAYD
ncbi:CBS domain-containing protein [Cylindrospermopsis raciborskii]|uniref:Phosphoribulokinase n=1 Tax=Cylindrospermopsis raciborskii CENA302 TaxID=1170768 RepID=A0A9Q5QX56_9CYAN|nr:CBS domain-containing protein [Cylindrospermopsis raciborskii]NLQ03880.1 CBS domain-containing protein [Cylindrospermopsis raciborskii MVCC19]OHY33292.1 phosphoribulokinase [Cylindrospermopsis raciborskii MVCC14]OPH09995.1 phosphoribulokinase [Cylindrospermopsis raciborskii CENA302]